MFPDIPCCLSCSLYLKEEALDFLEEDTIKDLIKKYSQFINFPVYLWCSKVNVFSVTVLGLMLLYQSDTYDGMVF